MTAQSNVRLAVSSDLDSLIELDAIAGLEARRLEFIAQAISAGQCWVAVEPRDASMLLGYGVLNDSFFEQAFIPLIVVRDSARRRGVGSAILLALESQCGAAKLFTSTNASNEPMRRLLDKHGFIASGQIENLDEGDPELVLVKLRY
ncbi:GNAT family N-acetyltransferase [Pseudomonas sp. GD04087]|uniref:GNAT family N-acetyltransferase n=1 Tax=unclassified Pseudomonas TaxID=196821 RepID=UPI00244C748D|nr:MULTISPECIES: GNAT family N-acetyltransferase [unclassified Pseudomonas]MDH0288488.1 GNAT family N-acetyltransferase [Pseudomonas sp. GD04087]MDH1051712.1 GNAT family N-acetyltransferase [Pseudomonas sp. GD03903]MDH2002464.1 GNAT family N-acetyltransferase [Pseudomonas sp. GD03691]